MEAVGLLADHPLCSGCAVAAAALLYSAATRKPEPPAEVQAAAKAKEPWESHVVPALSGLQELAPGHLWQVSAKGASNGPPMRNMTLYRPPGSRDLVVFSAVALEPPLMQQVEALGRPAVLVVPNAYHREDAAVWKARYPDLKVCAPSGSKWIHERISKVVSVDFDARELSQLYGDAIQVEAIDGWNENSTEVFEYYYTLKLADGTRAYYVCDMLLRTDPGFMSWVFGSGPLPGGFPRVGRLGKLFLHDRKRVAKFYVQLAQQDISIICYAHGEAFRGDCRTLATFDPIELFPKASKSLVEVTKLLSCRAMGENRTVASRTSYITNAVEQMVGHAGSREVASDAGHLSSNKPFRYMVLRYVQWSELIPILRLKDHQVVLRDFRYKPEDSCNVVTTYFSTQLEVVMAAVQEKFAWLDDEDDPRIIRAALQDDEFVLLLRGYFEAGDTERRGRSLIEIVEERIQKGSGSRGNPQATFNILARAFGRAPLAAGSRIRREDLGDQMNPAWSPSRPAHIS
ncbi:unnamed protein product [Symbiodinium natans]|uniref:Uncharacterized protein n=1 Tax=Symbiodinium natans TaxID=878477 RepID=A0A812RIX1_9DINO|nr:unnamed protein product [Symbiodinium natans]